MERKSFGEFYYAGDTDLETFSREFSSCDPEDIRREIANIFEQTGAFKCRVSYAHFFVGVMNGGYLELEIPGTRIHENGFFFHGIKLYTLDEVKKEVKNSLPVLAQYLEIKMNKLKCDRAVKLRSALFEPFGEHDTFIEIRSKQE